MGGMVAEGLVGHGAGNGKANKVPSAAQTLVMEPERGESGSAAERSEGAATTSGSVTANSRPNTNTVSSGIKLDKVILTRDWTNLAFVPSRTPFPYKA